MSAIIWLVSTLFNLYFYVLVAMVIMSWLLAFGIVNSSNSFVRQVQMALNALTEPALAPIRRILPDLGGLDFSPIVLIIGLEFVRQLVLNFLIRMA
jgi:YggT family protein